MPKSIKIEEAAFQRLDERRRPGESLSEVIIRCVPMQRSLEEVSKLIRAEISEQTLDAMDDVVKRHRRTPRTRRS